MEKGKLYLVGTPIGNLEDITYRAIKTLKEVDFIVAEDTRVTLKLMNHYDMKNKLISYHKYSTLAKSQQIINKIVAGESCALVSDAGMPCISDPGEQLVKLAKENGVTVTVVPGPCAAIAGLAISGMDTSQFVFEGFLSTNKKNKLESLNSLINEHRTIIFYEAPHKLKNTLSDLFKIFGNRKISIIKEITKIHESAMMFNLKDSIDYFNSVENIKGEFVLVLEGNKEYDAEEIIDVDEAVNMIYKLHNDSDIPYSEAVKIVAEKTGHKKNELYKLMVETKENILIKE